MSCWCDLLDLTMSHKSPSLDSDTVSQEKSCCLKKIVDETLLLSPHLSYFPQTGFKVDILFHTYFFGLLTILLIGENFFPLTWRIRRWSRGGGVCWLWAHILYSLVFSFLVFNPPYHLVNLLAFPICLLEYILCHKEITERQWIKQNKHYTVWITGKNINKFSTEPNTFIITNAPSDRALNEFNHLHPGYFVVTKCLLSEDTADPWKMSFAWYHACIRAGQHGQMKRVSFRQTNVQFLRGKHSYLSISPLPCVYWNHVSQALTHNFLL